MAPIKIGIIGLGIMGSGHFQILKAQPENYEITALCDTNPERLDKEEYKGIACFSDYNELLDSGLCELVAVVTPHPCHGEIAEAALRRGINVMCEKPLTESMSKTDSLLETAKKSGKLFSTNFSMRTYPVNRIIKKMLDNNEVGKIIRVDFVCTAWLRSQRYYDMQSWRGCWKGEGGGVLMNQAPHNLDLLFWWFGEMKSVRGKIGTRLHTMETEDEVEATFINHAGFPIRFYANTGEAPGIDRIEIVGDKGTLIREKGSLSFKKLETPVSELLAGDQAFPPVKSETEEIPVPTDTKGDTADIWRNIAKAFRNEEKLIAPGNEAWAAVEFANAITISHFTNSEVTFPIDRGQYDELLADLISGKKDLK